MKYAPSSLANYALTTSLAALDGTNLTISFVAPPSGNVIIEANVHVRQNLITGVGESYTSLAFVTHGTSTAVSLQQRVIDTNNSQAAAGNFIGQFCTLRQLVTGLTPGNSYQWDLAGLWNGSSASFVYVDNGASGSIGPALLTVTAA